MSNNDILIIRCNIVISDDRMKDLYSKLYYMRNDGLFLLPSYCEVVIAPKDTIIKMEENNHVN